MSDIEQPICSSSSSTIKAEKSFSQIDGADEPLLSDYHYSENYSGLAAVLPFLFPAFGGLQFGYDIGATACATMCLVSATFSGITWYNLSPVDIGLITSGSLYGALIGCVLAYNIADFLGRRRELIAASLSYLVGALVMALSPNLVVLIIGRFVYGIGIGLSMHGAPLYIAETAPRQIRGLLVSLKEFFIVLGMIGGYGVGCLLVDNIGGWRYMFGASMPLSLLMGIGVWWLPASPRWLLLRAVQGKGNMQDLKDSATHCLCRLRGKAIGNSASEQVKEILNELGQVAEEKEITFREMFQGKCLKALSIGGGLVLFQQITGQPSVMYYAATILQSAGFSAATDATRVSVLLGFLKLVMTGLAVLVVDKIGRRPLLLVGVPGMVVSLFLLGSYYTFLDNIPVVAVGGLLMYVSFYQLSFGPIGWLIISEVFPSRLRGRGLSIAVLVNFGANALVTFSFSPLKAFLGVGTLFYIFGGIAIVAVIFIFFIIPETKGLTLEEIEATIL